MLDKHNALADAIYRQQWCRFRVLGPTADQQPRVIPASFHNALFKIKKNVHCLLARLHAFDHFALLLQLSLLSSLMFMVDLSIRGLNTPQQTHIPRITLH